MLQKIKDFYNEFKPAINFLLRFCLTFGALSLIYGFWVKSYGASPDPVTRMVASHIQGILKLFSPDVTTSPRVGDPSVDVFINGTYSISVFEGCNGVAIVNLFFSFLVGFWGNAKKLAIYTIVGILVIHLANLARLVLLARFALTNSQLFHFTHKYLFTLSIYVIVFILWYFWVVKINPVKRPVKTADGTA